MDSYYLIYYEDSYLVSSKRNYVDICESLGEAQSLCFDIGIKLRMICYIAERQGTTLKCRWCYDYIQDPPVLYN